MIKLKLHYLAIEVTQLITEVLLRLSWSKSIGWLLPIGFSLVLFLARNRCIHNTLGYSFKHKQNVFMTLEVTCVEYDVSTMPTVLVRSSLRTGLLPPRDSEE